MRLCFLVTIRGIFLVLCLALSSSLFSPVIADEAKEGAPTTPPADAPPTSTPPADTSPKGTLPPDMPPPPATRIIPERVLCDGLPHVDRGVAMAPVRPVCDFLKADLVFHDGLLTLTKNFGGPNLARTVSMRLGGKSAQIWDGGASRSVNLPRPAESRLGTLFLPAKFLVEILGGQLEVDKEGIPMRLLEGERVGVFTSNYAPFYDGADAARVTFINRVGRTLSLRLSGPQKMRIEIGVGAKIFVPIKPGLYYYQAGSSGMQTIKGARRLLAGHKTSWAWGAGK